jgi:hypothetical protein
LTPLNRMVYESIARDPWDCEGKIDALLAAGADMDETDKWGCMPLLNAASIPWDNELFRLLQARGARMDVIDGMKRSILHYAAAYGDLEHIEYLRGLALAEPDPDSRNHYQHTPMSLMEWRWRAEKRKLWTNVKRPTQEEVDALGTLMDETRSRREARAPARMPHSQVANSNQNSGHAGEDDGGASDDGDDVLSYFDAVEFMTV